MFIVLKWIDRLIEKLSTKDIRTNVFGLSRTILASCTLLTLLFNSPETLFKPNGIGNSHQLDLIFVNRLNFFYLFPYRHIHLLLWLAISLLVVVASGWRPRVTGIIHFWISLSFIDSAMLIEGGDQIVSNLTLLMLPICLMDSRKWHWEKENQDETYLKERNLISNFFLFIIRLQVCIIYFHSAIGKMFVEEWRNGTAVYYWFNDPVFGMVNWMKSAINPLLYNPFVIVLLTWGTIFMEILLFMGISIQKQYRKYLLVSGILFHFCIVFVHGLFSFFLAMTGALILYLGPVEKNILLNVGKCRTSFRYFAMLNLRGRMLAKGIFDRKDQLK